MKYRNVIFKREESIFFPFFVIQMAAKEEPKMFCIKVSLLATKRNTFYSKEHVISASPFSSFILNHVRNFY